MTRPIPFRPQQPLDPFEAEGHSGYPACLVAAATGLEEGRLTETESGRIKRVLSASRQAEMRGSFLLRRNLIADLTGAKFSAVVLSAQSEGAPILLSPSGWTISLANKASLTIVALANEAEEIGVDLELIRPLDWHPMLTMICEAPERTAFERRFGHQANAHNAFFRMWTLKEAVLKTTLRGFRAGPKDVDTSNALGAGGSAGQLTAFGSVFDFWTVTHGDTVISLARRCRPAAETRERWDWPRRS